MECFERSFANKPKHYIGLTMVYVPQGPKYITNFLIFFIWKVVRLDVNYYKIQLK